MTVTTTGQFDHGVLRWQAVAKRHAGRCVKALDG
jgi:hypothetical protein